MPWIIPVVQAGVGIAQGVAAGEAGKAAASAAEQAAAAQRKEFTKSGIKSRNALRAGETKANAAITSGRDSALAGYQQAADRGIGAVEQGLGRAESTLANTMALQRYGDQAARSIGAYDVLGGQDRMGAMLDRGWQLDTDPGYQFRLQQGQEAINRQAAASGGRLSGRTMGALSEYSQNLASQEAANSFGRYQSMVGMSGQSDALRHQLLLNQAGRTDTAALAAQANQMGLAQMGYGAAGQLAGMQYGAGNTMAGIYGNLGAQQGQANLWSAGQMSTNSMNTAGGLANSYAMQGQQLAGTHGAAVPYAGAEWGGVGVAMGNLGNMANQYAAAGIDAAKTGASGGFGGGAGGAAKGGASGYDQIAKDLGGALA